MNFRKSLCSLAFLTAAASVSAFETIPLLVADGRAYAAAVLVDDKGAEHEGLFLIDTGTSGTFVLTSAVTPGAWTYETAQSSNLTIEWGMTTLYGTAKTAKKPTLRELRMGGFSLYDVPVLEFSEIPGWTPGTVNAGGRQWTVVGILGNDVLMRESFYLSLARREMGWTENPPFRGSQSWEMVPTADPTPIYRLRDAFGGDEESLFLVDTGSVTDVLAPETVDDEAKQDPRRWLRIAEADGTSVSGLWEGLAPLQAGTAARHVRALPQLEGAGYQILGTETLSGWDLWFEKTGLTSVELQVLPAPEAGRQEFLGSIVWPNWNFPTALRGVFYDPDTLAVTAVCQWGDGTPLVPGLDVGDTLVSLPPEGSDLLAWRKPDGTEVSAIIPRSSLFP